MVEGGEIVLGNVEWGSAGQRKYLTLSTISEKGLWTRVRKGVGK